MDNSVATHEAEVAWAQQKVNDFSEGWLRAAKSEVSKRPGPAVGSENTAPIPAGQETYDVVTVDGRKEVMRYKSAPTQAGLMQAQLARQAELWPFLSRAYDQRPTDEDSFIWRYMCNQVEQRAASDEFKKRDLINSKRDEMKRRVAEAKIIKKIRFRQAVSYRNYDFEAGRITLSHTYTGFALPNNAPSITSYMYLYRMENGRDRNLFPMYLAMDEGTARAVTAENPKRQLWADIEADIFKGNSGRLYVRATSVLISTPSGSRTWTLPVR